MMQLYTFFRSGTSHRVRIALNLKGIDAELIPIDLRTEAHTQPEYKSVNPQGLVPSLVDDQLILTQSPAILEWLEEAYPEPAFLPEDINQRAYVRALAALIGCDVHPINNRRILERLRKVMGHDEAAINAWCQTWIEDGFEAYEALLKRHHYMGKFSFGDEPGMAELYLIPQVESAQRFKVDMTRFPLISKINENCMVLDAFIKAASKNQPEAS